MINQTSPQSKRQRRSTRLQKQQNFTTSADTKNSCKDGTQLLRQLLTSKKKKNILIVSGSGMSAEAGFSTFSSNKNGFYAKAAKKFKLANGQDVFRYSFYQERPHDAFSFYRRLYRQSCQSQPTLTHKALQLMQQSGQLMRHYTFNIDGLSTDKARLAEIESSSDKEQELTVVELHGSLHQLICTFCGTTFPTTSVIFSQKSWPKSPSCPKCDLSNSNAFLRFRVLLYDDPHADLIVHPNHLKHLQQDLQDCKAIVWMGISFEQQASCEHFERMLPALDIPIFIVNPEAEQALFCLQTTVGGLLDHRSIYLVPYTCDEVFSDLLV